MTEIDLIRFDKVASIILIILIFMTGFFEAFFMLRKYRKRRDYVFSFREKVVDWFNSNCEDRAAYDQIVYESPRAQKYMGAWGKMDFQPPFKNYIVKNWNIILNAIPMINQYSSEYVLRGQAFDFKRMVDESLLRCLGGLDEAIEGYENELKSPISWLFRGGNLVISIPIILFLEFGLISSKIYQLIRESLLFKLFVFSATMVGLIAAAVTIVVGWDQFYNIILSLITA